MNAALISAISICRASATPRPNRLWKALLKGAIYFHDGTCDHPIHAITLPALLPNSKKTTYAPLNITEKHFEKIQEISNVSQELQRLWKDPVKKRKPKSIEKNYFDTPMRLMPHIILAKLTGTQASMRIARVVS